MSSESQKGVLNVPRCPIKNQKGGNTIDFVQR